MGPGAHRVRLAGLAAPGAGTGCGVSGYLSDVTITGYLERLRSEGKLETVDDTELHSADLPTA